MKPVKNPAIAGSPRAESAIYGRRQRLVTYFVEGLGEVVTYAERHVRDLMASLPRRVISKLLPGTRGRRTLEQAIQD